MINPATIPFALLFFGLIVLFIIEARLTRKKMRKLKDKIYKCEYCNKGMLTETYRKNVFYYKCSSCNIVKLNV